MLLSIFFYGIMLLSLFWKPGVYVLFWLLGMFDGMKLRTLNKNLWRIKMNLNHFCFVKGSFKVKHILLNDEDSLELIQWIIIQAASNFISCSCFSIKKWMFYFIYFSVFSMLFVILYVAEAIISIRVHTYVHVDMTSFYLAPFIWGVKIMWKLEKEEYGKFWYLASLYHFVICTKALSLFMMLEFCVDYEEKL